MDNPLIEIFLRWGTFIAGWWFGERNERKEAGVVYSVLFYMAVTIVWKIVLSL